MLIPSMSGVSRSLLVTSLTLAVIGFAGSFLPPSAQAVYPGANGRILYTLSTPGSTGQRLVTINPDGTRRATIYSTPGSIGDAAWSPDGRRIAAIVSTEDSGDRIVVMDADGGDAQTLTIGRPACYHPAPPPSNWGPFATFPTSKATPRRCDPPPPCTEACNPPPLCPEDCEQRSFWPAISWSADATELTFVNSGTGGQFQLQTQAIQTVPGGGGEPVVVWTNHNPTPTTIGSSAPFITYGPLRSPDGKTIAMIMASDLYVLPADGSGLPAKVASTDQDEDWFAWQPNGRILLRRNAGTGTDFAYTAWSVRADGTDARSVSMTANDPSGLDGFGSIDSWTSDAIVSPDGLEMVDFNGGTSGSALVRYLGTRGGLAYQLLLDPDVDPADFATTGRTYELMDWQACTGTCPRFLRPAIQHARTVRSFSATGHLTLTGTVAVTSGGAFARCTSSAPYVLERRAGKRWARVGAGTTTKSGSFSKSVPDAAGTYRIRIAAKTFAGTPRHQCGAVTKVVSHRHARTSR